MPHVTILSRSGQNIVNDSFAYHADAIFRYDSRTFDISLMCVSKIVAGEQCT